MTVSGVTAPKGPLISHITGGYKGAHGKNSQSDLDCSEFTSDYDILYHFPFFIMINPIVDNWDKSTAYMDKNGDFVVRLYLRDEDAVPLSIFCLQNLDDLSINNVSFPDGIVPDNLENLRQLRYLYISSSTVVNMTERLGTMRNLNSLTLYNCSLTHLPNLSGIPALYSVDLDFNLLSRVDGLTSVDTLYLSNNLFTDIPKLNKPNSLRYLFMYNNPLKNMLAITSHVNLEYLYLSNTTLSSIPPTIDRLQKLYSLDLSDNKLFSLPTNMLNLAKLQYLYIQNNLFPSAEIEVYKQRFNVSHPNMTLYSD